ncbi:hypothetical protein [Streptomyces cucumeris]|uniref:hypothetical protein n=1 Tax=Streptomyces cucumeris TaxID=2962890 RepID=UPI0020C8AD21|nr:hypothetical protein [Streptomyces sp. NEAU-Y11]MCP9210968.1 hypothetical protein [Streptomyces sp. NEAU-Y11]
MRWWVKARRVHWVLPPTLAAFAVLVAMLHNLTTFLPAFSSGGAVQVRASLFIPVCLASGLMMCLESRLEAPEHAAQRRVTLLDIGLTVTFVTAAMALSLASAVLTTSPEPLAIGRNTVFLTGLMLVARRWAGPPAVMAPFAWIMAVLFVGFRTPNDPRPWTIIPEPVDAVHAALGSGVMFTIGLIAQLHTSRKLA